MCREESVESRDVASLSCFAEKLRCFGLVDRAIGARVRRSRRVIALHHRDDDVANVGWLLGAGRGHLLDLPPLGGRVRGLRVEGHALPEEGVPRLGILLCAWWRYRLLVG